MDLLKKIDEKDKELKKCYAIIQLQMEHLAAVTDKIKHLEEILKHKAEIIDFKKEK